MPGRGNIALVLATTVIDPLIFYYCCFDRLLLQLQAYILRLCVPELLLYGCTNPRDVARISRREISS